MKKLFQKANDELQTISKWFCAKDKIHNFSQAIIKDKLPLKLPIFSIINYEIERLSNIKFIGVMVYEHLKRKDFINNLGSKLSKSLGLLHKAKKLSR